MANHLGILRTSLAVGACFGVPFCLVKVLTLVFPYGLGPSTTVSTSSQDLSVNYNPGAHTLSFHVRILLFTILLNNVDSHRRGNNVGDAHFLGASVTDLSSNSPT